MKGRTAVLGAAILFAAFALVVLVRCGGNPDDTLLDPSGGAPPAEGIITGTLDWGQGPPYPTTLVYAIRSYNPSCTGGPTSVHLTGELNNWDTGAWETTSGMTEIFPCLWLEKRDLAADDQFEWKFVVNKGWPGSYAAGGPGVDETTRRGTATNENKDNLRVVIPTADPYWFLLNTSIAPAYFWVLSEDQFLWDTTGADSTRFAIENLQAGTYTLILSVPGDPEGFPTRYVRGVRVRADQGVDLGTVSVLLTGAIQGTVAFSDDPPSAPETRIIALLASSGTPVDTLTIEAGGTAFSITGLNEDAYDLRFHAEGYVDTIVEGVQFEADDEVDLGTVRLARGGAVSGTVAFDDGPSVLPVATIYYEDPGSLVHLAETLSDPADGSFLLNGVPAGAVDIGVRARRYVDTTLAGVTVAAAETTSVGTVTLRPGCVSVATTVHILGQFNNWDTNLWEADPGMHRVESCLWRDTIEVFPAFTPAPEFKFTTDKDYTTPTADYVLCADRLTDYGFLYGPVCLVGEGNPPNLVLLGASIPGRYEMILDEDSLQYRARIVEEFDASIYGTIAYDTGLLPPFPPIAVSVRRSGESLVLASTSANTTTGAFGVGGLDAGTYDVDITASNMRDTTLTGITIAAGEARSLGSVTVTEVTCQSEFTVIRVVGDFTGWNTGAPSMTQIQACVWVDTLQVTSGCYFMKFRTAEDWGANDYMNCGPEDGTCQVPLSGTVCQGTSGDPALGKINFTTTGTYEFRLDEASLTYTITLLR